MLQSRSGHRRLAGQGAVPPAPTFYIGGAAGRRQPIVAASPHHLPVGTRRSHQTVGGKPHCRPSNADNLASNLAECQRSRKQIAGQYTVLSGTIKK